MNFYNVKNVFAYLSFLFLQLFIYKYFACKVIQINQLDATMIY